MSESIATQTVLVRALEIFGHARSVVFQAESLIGPATEFVVARKRPRLPTDDPQLFKAARKSLAQLIRRDSENIARGLYPVDVLTPESPVRHLLRFPEMLLEGVQLVRRRHEKSSHEFSSEAQDELNELPDYYRRNFHFQGDGYLSHRSARLYDHQVDILFAGCADAMRRLLLPPLRARLEVQSEEDLNSREIRILEIGCGTGRTTRFMKRMLPKAKIVALDLSSAYLKKAQADLATLKKVDFVEGKGENLPFQDASFDAVVSVFLFHELPAEIRRAVLRESLRVLKPGGVLGMVDSLQKGDVPEFDTALDQFPIEFHEPFYTHYVKNPMEKMFTELGLDQVEVETGFFAKSVFGTYLSSR